MTAKSDLHTILRHLVANTQWGGDHGGKAETMEAMDRLISDNPREDDPNEAPEPKTSGAAQKR